MSFSSREECSRGFVWVSHRNRCMRRTGWQLLPAFSLHLIKIKIKITISIDQLCVMWGQSSKRSSTCSTLAKALSSPGNPQKAFSTLGLVSAHHQTKPISAFEKSPSDFVALRHVDHDHHHPLHPERGQQRPLAACQDIPTGQRLKI